MHKDIHNSFNYKGPKRKQMSNINEVVKFKLHNIHSLKLYGGIKNYVYNEIFCKMQYVKLYVRYGHSHV